MNIPRLWLPVVALLIIPRVSFSQSFSTREAAYASCFEEVHGAEERHVDLWNMNMYGPILLVNPSTRQVYSNFPDAGGALRQDGPVYTGYLPEEINIANTKVHWNGRTWAMVMLPLPSYKNDRVNLLAHELFHVAQPSLGFQGYSPDNSQLDEKNGRILLRLELEALRKALESTSTQEMKACLTDAITFRLYRYVLYPQAKVSENLLELNEGLAEYTGLIVSGRSKAETLYHFERSINAFVKFPTFVRSFAYVTTPIYGYLLQQSDEYWNREITPETSLTDFFIRKFGLTPSIYLSSAVRSLENEYDGKLIRQEETTRETLRQQQVDKYRTQLVNSPHLEIRFERMHLSFDPTNVIPLDDNGNVYPTIRITDSWGILDVKNGGLLSPRWDMITVSRPTEFEGDSISGEGWTLKLTQGYRVVKDASDGNYSIEKSTSGN